MRIYNTMSGRKEEFKPIEEGKIRMYVCGPTVYNLIHIGNARPMIVFDTFRRYMEYRGYRFHYVSNYTDVDDKIIRAANERGIPAKEIADHYIEAYFRAMDALNVRHADVYPRVSETISDIIEMVQGLVNEGYAYELEGDVYYSVEKFAGYGKLSGRTLDDMMAGARVEVDERKRISNVRRCRSNIWARSLIFTAAAAI